MGGDICRARYNFVLGLLRQKEIIFKDNEIYKSDDGTYELSCEDFNNLKMKKGQIEKRYKAKHALLFDAFSKEVKKGTG